VSIVEGNSNRDIFFTRGGGVCAASVVILIMCAQSMKVGVENTTGGSNTGIHSLRWHHLRDNIYQIAIRCQIAKHHDKVLESN